MTARPALAFVALMMAQNAIAPRPLPQPTVDWQAMIPAIREALKSESGRNPEFRGVEENYSIGIEKTANVTGEGASEALVYLGTGGASTDELTVMRIEHDKPVLALFRDRDGKVSPMVFAEGASVMHTDGVDLRPREHSIFSIHYDYNGNGKLHQCGGEAFIWNSHTKTFDYNLRLTKKITQTSCRQVPKALE